MLNDFDYYIQLCFCGFHSAICLYFFEVIEHIYSCYFEGLASASTKLPFLCNIMMGMLVSEGDILSWLFMLFGFSLWDLNICIYVLSSVSWCGYFFDIQIFAFTSTCQAVDELNDSYFFSHNYFSVPGRTLIVSGWCGKLYSQQIGERTESLESQLNTKVVVNWALCVPGAL